MEEPKTHDITLNVFKTINGFVKNMNDCYGAKQKTLQLYARLISKTTIEDEAPISRHILAFKNFCTENKDAILEKNHKKIVNSKISYNEKVYINMEHIFGVASGSEKIVIWKHILTIFALIDPQSRAKEMLREVIDKDGKGGKEEEFLTDIFDKVGTNIQPDGNPLQAVGNLMSSGVFTDIVGSMSSGLESGELDLGRLMGSMQGMVTNIGSMAEQNGQAQQPEMAEMLGQMSAMMGNLNKMTTEQGDKKSDVSEEEVGRGAELATSIINSQTPLNNVQMQMQMQMQMPMQMPMTANNVEVPVNSSESKFEIIEEDDVTDVSQTPKSSEKVKHRKKKKKDKKGVNDIPVVLESQNDVD